MTTPNAPQSFVIKTNGTVFDWPGGQGVDIGGVRVVLNDLALYFNAPQ